VGVSGATELVEKEEDEWVVLSEVKRIMEEKAHTLIEMSNVLERLDPRGPTT